MIICRSPLRIVLAAGGCDLPSYYRKFGGFTSNVGINKYVYVSIQNTFEKEIVLRYSQIERVKNISEIKHPIIREALKLAKINDLNIELTTMTDIPGSSGLGGSSSFTCALLKALFKFKNQTVTPERLAEMACDLEINILNQKIGKQDQYGSAISGFNTYIFNKDNSVYIKQLNISKDTIEHLENNLILVPTGIYRSASKMLEEQDSKTNALDPAMINNLHYVKELGFKNIDALESGNLYEFGKLMHEYWEHKKKRSSGISNSDIDKLYQFGLDNGAVGGKVGGAGGGGMILFYTEEKAKLLKALKKADLSYINFNFDYEGTKIL